MHKSNRAKGTENARFEKCFLLLSGTCRRSLRLRLSYALRYNIFCCRACKNRAALLASLLETRLLNNFCVCSRNVIKMYVRLEAKDAIYLYNLYILALSCLLTVINVELLRGLKSN